MYCSRIVIRTVMPLIILLRLISSAQGEVLKSTLLLPDVTLEHARIAENMNIINTQLNESERESPLRRFEITFIISLPFIFLTNFLILHVADVIILKDPNVNVWDNHGPFLVVNTITIATILSYREARIFNEMQKSRGDNRERTLYLSYSTRY
jgi:hypothetical protein